MKKKKPFSVFLSIKSSAGDSASLVNTRPKQHDDVFSLVVSRS
ncbi:hypothetical protein GLYMA_18G218100v4 [Glycine max]|uniref:Uncharacterized protein n=1 Tax=Glycine max TaxID=3847 RepID=A0A0R0FCU3_SOYBN|nr:hypothetical protein GLYMA_18G218100v4 [Glycine max]